MTDGQNAQRRPTPRRQSGLIKDDFFEEPGGSPADSGRYDDLVKLIPHFDIDARLRMPGRLPDGSFRANTEHPRALMDVKSMNEKDLRRALPKTAHDEDVVEQLRDAWVGLYLNAMTAPGKAARYTSLLGVNPRSLRGEDQAVVIQVIGAMEETLNEAGWTIEDVVDIDPSGAAHVRAPETAVPNFGFGFKSPPRPAISPLPAQIRAVETVEAIAAEAKRLVEPSVELNLDH